MNESEFPRVENSGRVFPDCGDPDPDLMQAKLIIAARIIAALIVLLISSPIGTSHSAEVPAIIQSDTFEVWPAGTRLRIPNRVKENYKEEADSWSDPYVYLLANHFLTGPSLQDQRKETVYIPLVKEQAGEAERREVFVDFFQIRRISDNPSVFVTDVDMHIIRGTCKTLLDQEPDPRQGTGLGAIGNDFWLERRFVPPSEEPDRGVGFCFGLVFGVRA